MVNKSMDPYNKDISPIIHQAINIIKNSFGGTEVDLISDKMYRSSPNEFKPLGELGVDIKIMNIKTFLSCELAENIGCTPYGQKIADEYVYQIIKPAYPDKL